MTITSYDYLLVVRSHALFPELLHQCSHSAHGGWNGQVITVACKTCCYEEIKDCNIKRAVIADGMVDGWRLMEWLQRSAPQLIFTGWSQYQPFGSKTGNRWWEKLHTRWLATYRHMHNYLPLSSEEHNVTLLCTCTCTEHEDTFKVLHVQQYSAEVADVLHYTGFLTWVVSLTEAEPEMP